jgi:hypothetical protein
MRSILNKAPSSAPERVRLAEAIATHAEQDRIHTLLSNAQGAADESVWAARAAVEAATEVLTKAKAGVGQHAVDALAGLTSEPSMSVKAARTALVDAEDALEGANAAREALKTRTAVAGAECVLLKEKVEAAALAVIKAEPGLEAIVEELDRLQREVLDKSEAFRWLVEKRMISTTDIKTGDYSIDRPLAIFVKLRTERLQNEWKKDIQVPGALPWQQYLAALQVDANATMPTS